MSSAGGGSDRRERMRGARAGRHSGARGGSNFEGSFEALGEIAYAGASVSANAVDLGSGTVLVSIDDRVVLPTAAVGTVLLLIEVSARMTANPAAGDQILDKPSADAPDSSTLWARLIAPALPVSDLAALVGATNDGLAVNALLRLVGLDAVRERGEALGLDHTALLDLVRDERGPDDAPQLSVGAAAELSWLLTALSRGQVVDRMTSERVLDWLAAGVNLSMVASAFGLDPLSHRRVDHGIRLVNLTGTAPGVRSEVGILTGATGSVAYALSVQFADTSLSTRLAVLAAMRSYGTDLLEYVS